MENYPISFCHYYDIKDIPRDYVITWHDLGITVGMSPRFNAEDKETIIKMLDEAELLGIKILLCDNRTRYTQLANNGEEKYRELCKQALEDFGNHKATYGFFLGDEPGANIIADALKALSIHNEYSSHLTAYINLLPWFDWIGPHMGSEVLAPYLDRVVNEGKAKVLSYDCYTQLLEGQSGYTDYFNNLREYYLATKRLSVPYWNVVLSCGHYYYRCPTKDDFNWQLGTSVAHGAKGISYYFLHLSGVRDNYRNPPINQFGERTETFTWLSEVNKLFNAHCGKIMMQLKIDTCYHVEKAYGGMQLFEPFGNIISVKSENNVPLIFSRFYDDNNNVYYLICCNSVSECTRAEIKFKSSVKIEKCMMGNQFKTILENTKEVSTWLYPGQITLFKESQC